MMHGNSNKTQYHFHSKTAERNSNVEFLLLDEHCGIFRNET